MIERNNDDEITIDLVQIFRTLWDRAAAILLAGILCGALFFTYAHMFISPVYEASALLYVNNSTFSISSSGFTSQHRP